MCYLIFISILAVKLLINISGAIIDADIGIFKSFLGLDFEFFVKGANILVLNNKHKV
jgi:hypothetical protein